MFVSKEAPRNVTHSVINRELNEIVLKLCLFKEKRTEGPFTHIACDVGGYAVFFNKDYERGFTLEYYFPHGNQYGSASSEIAIFLQLGGFFGTWAINEVSNPVKKEKDDEYIGCDYRRSEWYFVSIPIPFLHTPKFKLILTGWFDLKKFNVPDTTTLPDPKLSITTTPCVLKKGFLDKKQFSPFYNNISDNYSHQRDFFYLLDPYQEYFVFKGGCFYFIPNGKSNEATEKGYKKASECKFNMDFKVSYNTFSADCGSASLIGFSSQVHDSFTAASKETQKIVLNVAYLLYLHTLQAGLSMRAYLTSLYKDEYSHAPINQLHHLICSKYGVSVENFHPGYKEFTIGVDDTDKLYRSFEDLRRDGYTNRGRRFGLITHKTLCDFYASEDFKNLNLMDVKVTY